MFLRREILLTAFKLFDLIVMIVSFGFGFLTVYLDVGTISLHSFLAVRVEIHNFIIFLLCLFSWHYIFCFFGLYDSKRMPAQESLEIIDIFKATSVATIMAAIIAVAFSVEVININFLIVFFLTNFSLLISSRFILRLGLKQLRLKGRNLRNALIVGTNHRAMRIVKELEEKKELGYHILGFVDDAWSGNKDFHKTGYHIVTDFVNFGNFLKSNVVDEVLICIPVKSLYEQCSRILYQCEEQGIIVRFIPSVFTLKRGTLDLEHFNNRPVMTINTGAMRGDKILIKRVLDIFVSLALLIFFTPVFLAIMLAIKMDSSGKIFFIQERLGLNKRKFMLMKFRTMVSNAEQKIADLEDLNEASGPVFKIKDDPRVTRVGKFLRKTSLDELPQLINVVKGEMSLVGPRPLPVRDYEGFDREWHLRRFSVRPGITCLWQIQGRSNIPFERWMQLDMDYIDHWSLWLDMKILLKTIPVIFRGEGAY
jgi:exopolysaccharide biosynthesis polyprenyl glycosylphosphotransferase